MFRRTSAYSVSGVFNFVRVASNKRWSSSASTLCDSQLLLPELVPCCAVDDDDDDDDEDDTFPPPPPSAPKRQNCAYEFDRECDSDCDSILCLFPRRVPSKSSGGSAWKKYFPPYS